jgi:hypothetical protein
MCSIDKSRQFLSEYSVSKESPEFGLGRLKMAIAQIAQSQGLGQGIQVAQGSILAPHWRLAQQIVQDCFGFW